MTLTNLSLISILYLFMYNYVIIDDNYLSYYIH